MQNTDNDAALGVTEHTGFPNPATDTHITSLDIANLLVKHPASTFFMQIAGNAWQARGIFDGDIVVIDRALDPKKTDTVIWWQGENFVISEQRAVPNATPVWGTVTSIIHRCRT